MAHKLISCLLLILFCMSCLFLFYAGQDYLTQKQHLHRLQKEQVLLTKMAQQTHPETTPQALTKKWEKYGLFPKIDVDESLIFFKKVIKKYRGRKARVQISEATYEETGTSLFWEKRRIDLEATFSSIKKMWQFLEYLHTASPGFFSYHAIQVTPLYMDTSKRYQLTLQAYWESLLENQFIKEKVD
jgi:hypothetical protein